MEHPDWTHTDSREAKHIWEEYQKQHNLSDRIGQTVGIDPKSKRIWFGTSIPRCCSSKKTLKGWILRSFLNALALKPIFAGKTSVIRGTVSTNGVPTIVLSITVKIGELPLIQVSTEI